jgi:hypothetical protein
MSLNHFGQIQKLAPDKKFKDEPTNTPLKAVLRNRSRNRNRRNRIILTQEEPEPYPFSRFRFRFLLHKKYQLNLL